MSSRTRTTSVWGGKVRSVAVDPSRRLRFGLLALAGVLVAGTGGYVALGFPLLDAVYQTVITVTTVGYREVRPLSGTGQVFTIVLILTGVGTALYCLTLAIQTVVEGELAQFYVARGASRWWWSTSTRPG